MSLPVIPIGLSLLLLLAAQGVRPPARSLAPVPTPATRLLGTSAEAFVHHDRDGTELLRLLLGTPGDRFGFAVAALDDVNGDGSADFLVGAPDDDHPVGFQSGTVYVISGHDGAVLRTIEGDEPEQQLGHALARIGDADGDGVGDFAVSGDQTDTFFPGPGFARRRFPVLAPGR